MINKKLKKVFLIVAAAMAILLVIVLGRLAWAYYQVSNAETIPESFDAAEMGSTGSLSILPLFEAWTSSNEL